MLFRSAGGIGGAVSFRPKSAADYLRGDKTSYFGLKAGYNSANRMWSEAVTAAGRSGAFDGLISYVRRDGHEARNNSPLGIRSKPEKTTSNALLFKGDWHINAAHKLSLTADMLLRRHRAEYESSWLSPRMGTETSYSWQRDKTERQALQTHPFVDTGGRVVRPDRNPHLRPIHADGRHHRHRHQPQPHRLCRARAQPQSLQIGRAHV